MAQYNISPQALTLIIQRLSDRAISPRALHYTEELEKEIRKHLCLKN